MISFAERPQKNTEFAFFSDSLGLKRQHHELDSRTQQMYIRESQLSNCETQLMKKRKMFNARVEEFNGRKKLMKPKDIILERTTVTNQGIIFAKPEEAKSKDPAISDYHEILDKIPQSAAIVQRGILKQINSSFVTLLGYTINEVVEKSFFDFIALEGVADVEKYYIDRLKGESVSTYRTVFSTKDNNKIPVEVRIQQIIYNGEKTEIVIITCLEKSEPRLMHELAPKKSR
jgi:PAS domain S-box-containing protein